MPQRGGSLWQARIPSCQSQPHFVQPLTASESAITQAQANSRCMRAFYGTREHTEALLHK